jgi:hypothetical protein
MIYCVGIDVSKQSSEFWAGIHQEEVPRERGLKTLKKRFNCLFAARNLVDRSGLDQIEMIWQRTDTFKVMCRKND